MSTNASIAVSALDNEEESKEEEKDRSTSVNESAASTSSPKGMFDRLKNILGRGMLRESRLFGNNQNRFNNMASESGANLTSDQNNDAREDIARASQDANALLLKSRSVQPNS